LQAENKNVKAIKCRAKQSAKMRIDEKIYSDLGISRSLTATADNLLLLQLEQQQQQLQHLPHKWPFVLGRYLTQGRENNEPNDFRPLI